MTEPKIKTVHFEMYSGILNKWIPAHVTATKIDVDVDDGEMLKLKRPGRPNQVEFYNPVRRIVVL